MASDTYRIGGGAGDTVLSPVVMIILLVTIALIFLLPRKYVIVPLLFTAILAPFGQQVYLSGMHWYIGRILTVCGLIRIAGTKVSLQIDIASGGFNGIDKIFMVWATLRALATILLFLNPQVVVNQCAFLLDSIGGYVLLRFLIRDQDDLVRVVKAFVLIVSVLAATMAYEHFGQHNVFAYLGGNFLAIVREGEIRAQGPFEGPIPAGTFGATLLCLFVWLWRSGESRVLGIAGMIGSVLMAYTSKSSTPLVGVIAGIVALCAWPLRNNMRGVRWAMIVALVGLQLVMQAPVWFVVNHVSVVAGNSSYHRAMLVDQFIRHFSDWWLLGSKSTASWGYDLWDQANQFVKEGESGGLAGFVCFLLLISRSFGRLGSARKLANGDAKGEWLCWLLGCALLSQVVCFFGNSYSDQAGNGWVALLAIISTATTPILAMAGGEDDSDAGELAGEPQWDYASPRILLLTGNRSPDRP